MSNILGEEFKKIILAGIGAVAVSAEKSKDIVEELIKKGEVTVEQGKVLNEELKRKINEKDEKKEKDKVSSILEELDKMTPEELEKIKEKLQDSGEKAE